MTQATTFEGMWNDFEAAAISLVNSAEAKLKQLEPIVVSEIESDIVLFWSQFKDLAVKTVFDFMDASFSHLSGNEKFGQAVTTVFQQAEVAAAQVGKQIAVQDVQMLVQHAYHAVEQARGAIIPSA